MTLPSHVRAISGGFGAIAILALLGIAPWEVAPTSLSDLIQLPGTFLDVLWGSVSFLWDNPIIAAGRFLVYSPIIAGTTWLTFWPEHADRTLREGYDLDLADTGTLAAVIVHLVFAFVLFGVTLLSAAESLSTLVSEGTHPANQTSLTDLGIVLSLVFNLVLFLVAALTWIVLADKVRSREIFASLRMTVEGLPRGIVGGVVGAIAGILIAALLGFGLQQLGFTPQNPQAQAIADALTWETALAVAALAALGEEIYFRGFLLPRTSNLTQSVLFGIVHASYLTPLQIVLPFLLGLGFGWLTRATNLWGAVVAHFGFNAVMLFSAIHGEELAAALPALGLW